jgi:hypothetical protein
MILALRKNLSLPAPVWGFFMPSWFLLRNTVFLRNPHIMWKAVIFLLPGLDFIPNKISPAGVAKTRPLLIPALAEGNWDSSQLIEQWRRSLA